MNNNIKLNIIIAGIIFIVCILIFIVAGFIDDSYAESKHVGDWEWSDDYSYAILHLSSNKDVNVDSVYTEPTCEEDGYWTVEYSTSDNYYYSIEYAEGSAMCNNLILESAEFITGKEIICRWRCESCGCIYESSFKDVDNSNFCLNKVYQ